MMNQHEVIFLIVLLGASSTSTQAFQCYSRINRTVVDNSRNWLYPLDTDGLSGRYADYWSNNTGIEYGVITFQLWFLTYDARKYYLSLVALREPSQLWDIYRPFILWTANRNEPVTENATLSFDASGDWKLEDFGRVVWSTNTADKDVDRLCFSNLGNIYLVNSSGDIIWQSFDTPTNTFSLQVGMKPGIRLISWESDSDPRSGSYSLAMETDRLVLYKNSEPYWELRSPQENLSANENLFAAFCWQPSGVISVDLHNNASMFDDQQNFITANACAASKPLRRLELVRDAQNFSYGMVAKLSSSGDLVIYNWNTTSNYWNEAYKLSTNFSCFLPAQCGAYGICNSADGQCTTNCPTTFKSSSDEALGNSAVCRATRSLPSNSSSCTRQEFEMVKMAGMDYFSSNLSSSLDAANEEDCHSRCQTNCSCKASFYKPGSCFHTDEDVQSLKTGSYSASLKISTADQASILSRRHRNRFLRVALPVLVPSLVVLLFMLAWVTRRRNRSGDTEDLDEERDEAELESSLKSCLVERYSYRQLEKITTGFSTRLGQGGYGSVYKGTLENGAQVAVKKLQGSNQTSRDFYAEIASLARTHHLNLVKFLGFCAGGPKKRLLVYEFVPNGSLEKWIYDGEGLTIDDGLSWGLRFDIATGTAKGLAYLHEECSEKIIHLDLKPENVLLDSQFVPKIADFGLSRMMNREVTYLQMTSMRGTPGYLAPEYMQVGTITEKSDVFSYGVLLLEIITGRRNIELRQHHLTERFWSPAGLAKIDDLRIERLQGVAHLCVQDDPDLRPSMSLVVNMMEGLVELGELPPLSNLHFFLAYRSKVSIPVFSSTTRSSFKFSSSVSQGVSLSSVSEATTSSSSMPFLNR